MASCVVVQDLHAIFFANLSTTAGICRGMLWFLKDGRKCQRSLLLCDELDVLSLMLQLIRVILEVKNQSSPLKISATTAALNMALDIVEHVKTNHNIARRDVDAFFNTISGDQAPALAIPEVFQMQLALGVVHGTSSSDVKHAFPHFGF